MQATLREFEDWLEDSVPDAVMIGYEKALAKLEECLPFEDTLVSLETPFLPSPVFSATYHPISHTLTSGCHSHPTAQDGPPSIFLGRSRGSPCVVWSPPPPPTHQFSDIHLNALGKHTSRYLAVTMSHCLFGTTVFIGQL